MPVTSQDADPLTSRVYNSVWQLRADAWVSLAEVTRRLITDPPDPVPNESGAGLPEPAGAGLGAELLQRVEELFGLLEPIENCWAFPGRAGHKTLTSLRQGSMIHVFDQDFNHKVEETFREAYMTHTSTSPNYQILASLDLGRRQAELEGFELVQKQVEQAGMLRDAVEEHPLLHRYLRFLTTPDLIPGQFRPSGIGQPLRTGLARMAVAWENDEFVLDPTRATLYIGSTGIDGDTFKHRYLMDKHGVQVNKTTRNTLLFMTTIGTTRSAVSYLIEVLVKLVRDLEEQLAEMSPRGRAAHQAKVEILTGASAPLPDFSAFHQAFRPGRDTPEGAMRDAFYLAYDDSSCDYLPAEDISALIADGREPVSATFVTPYPPGFPVLVPGQVISAQVLAYMGALDTREIHGYRPELGYQIFTEAALTAPSPQSAR